ncbi:FAR1-related sequence 5-like protein [Tanacetum coccineum]
MIVTDQDGAIKKAIKAVFKKSKHRFCMWHIMQKIPFKILFESHEIQSESQEIHSESHEIQSESLEIHFECHEIQNESHEIQSE